MRIREKTIRLVGAFGAIVLASTLPRTFALADATAPSLSPGKSAHHLSSPAGRQYADEDDERPNYRHDEEGNAERARHEEREERLRERAHDLGDRQEERAERLQDKVNRERAEHERRERLEHRNGED
jgi:hypothetical protein